MDQKIHLQAILLDVDDTLCATSRFTDKARFAAVQAMADVGLSMPVDDLFKELNEVILEFSSNYPEHFNKLLLRIPAERYRGINKALLIAASVAAYHDAKYHYLKPYSDVIPFLDCLLDTNVVRGIITDGLAVKQAEKLIRLDVYHYFHKNAIFISDQLGVSKRNPKIYRLVCQSLDLCPEKTMYVGDHPERDIDSANEIGLITVRIRREGKYQNLEGKTHASHDVNDFSELQKILDQQYCLNNS